MDHDHGDNNMEDSDSEGCSHLMTVSIFVLNS